VWLLSELQKRSECDSVAIIHREKSISFKELWSRSESIAEFIRQKAGTKAPVMIYGDKQIDIICVMVAALKTGRAYVPVDITFPLDRLAQISEMVNSDIIFNFSDTEIPGESFLIINESELESNIFSCCAPYGSGSDENEWVSSDDLCYILFTSGSTGIPKGVQITRKNIENFVSWFSKDCDIGKYDTVLNQVSYSFDVSVISLYIYLAEGKTLFCIDKEMIQSTKLLFQYLETSNIASWISTPAFLEICSFDTKFCSKMMPNLKKFILAGEILTKRLVNTIHDKFNESCVINGYGPTEGTVLLSACEITDGMLQDEKSLPIGYILPNSIYRILDEKNNDVPYGKIGELVVVSDSISKGYYKNPEQTAKSFFSDSSGRTGYRTGDLVFEKDELVYYVSRKDFQIKLNGYRIELDDIMCNLNKIEFVNSSIVLPVYKEERVNYVVAFVCLNSKPDTSDIKTGIKIKELLKEMVPSYMVPRKIVILDKFPLNTSGKIDRKKLMEEL